MIKTHSRYTQNIYINLMYGKNMVKGGVVENKNLNFIGSFDVFFWRWQYPCDSFRF